MRKPNVFIVGAPKCGTTALHIHLSKHPEIFMSRVKEPGYFDSDLLRDRRAFGSLEQYLALFSDAGDAKRVGESSTAYLRSEVAAEAIRTFNPESRIIAMVRNPIEVMHSFHSQLLYQGEEQIADFEAALAAEPVRKQLVEESRGSLMTESVLYRNVVRFAQQIERYLRVFGRERVHVIVYDDLLRDAESVYERALRFLEVDATLASISFSVVNPNKKPRSEALHRFLVHPPQRARTVVRALVPKRGRAFLFGNVRRLNTAHDLRAPMSRALHELLAVELASEVEQLGVLLERDLSHWTKA